MQNCALLTSWDLISLMNFFRQIIQQPLFRNTVRRQRMEKANGLLKMASSHQERLVVAKDQNLWTCLIAEAHCQVSTAHLGKNKTRKIIGNCYYWPGMMIDIDQYVQNCNDCCQSTIPQDKTPGLLKPLPITER